MINNIKGNNYAVPNKADKTIKKNTEAIRDEVIISENDGRENNIIPSLKSETTVTDKGITLTKPLYSAICGICGNIAGNIMEHVIKPVTFNFTSGKKKLMNKIETLKSELFHKNDEIINDIKHISIAPLTSEDVKAAKPAGDMARIYDGYDSSRNIFALYSKEGKPEENYTFQLEVANLREGAEHEHLNSYFLLNWGNKNGSSKMPFELKSSSQPAPWKVSIKIDRNSKGEIIDNNGNSYGVPENINHSTAYSNIEFQIDKKVLRSLGWKDGEALNIQALTAKDEYKVVSDRITASTDVKGSDEILRNIFRWEGRVVYYAVTDRFNDGDKTNNAGIDLNDREKFHGGDWQGVIDKLDYIKSLGVDCIWLSCPYVNDRDFFGKDGFHGYWPHDFYKTEPHFGTMDKLRELTEKAHEKGIKIMLDVVVNHTGYNHPFVNDRDHSDWYHEKGDIKVYSEYHMVNRSLAGLPDLAHENPKVARYLIDVHKWWVEQSGIDAFRVDAARHVPEEFLRKFNEELHDSKENFYTVGEAFWRDPNFIAGLQNRGLDGMFDFPTAFAIRNVFASKKGESFWDRLKFAIKNFKEHPGDAIEKILRKSNPGMDILSEAMKNDEYYDNPKKLGTMIDNHDMSRFMNECGGDLNMVEIALSFLMSARGTPCIYYGTEAGLDGAADNNRKDMPWGQNPELTESFRKMAHARNSSLALQSGSQIEVMATEDVYAHERMRPEEEIMCIFNNSEETKDITVPLAQESQIKKGDILADLISGNKIEAGDSNIKTTLPPRGYVYYQWKK